MPAVYWPRAPGQLPLITDVLAETTIKTNSSAKDPAASQSTAHPVRPKPNDALTSVMLSRLIIRGGCTSPLSPVQDRWGDRAIELQIAGTMV